jgi:hypothetical protein
MPPRSFQAQRTTDYHNLATKKQTGEELAPFAGILQTVSNLG